MNGLKTRRTDLGLSQPDVVRLLRPRCPIMDVSLYSKIENGHCLPNAECLRALEAVLQAPRTQLLEADELAALPDDEGKETDHSSIGIDMSALKNGGIHHE